MRREHEQLLADLLEEPGSGERREATLRAGLAVARRRRACIVGSRVAAAAMLGLLIVSHSIPHRPATQVASAQQGLGSPAPQRVPGTSIRLLKDEDLLALFKGRPVALFGEPGHQRLVVFDE